MSVRTTADELIEKAREAVKLAATAVNEAMAEIVIKGDCWGADELSDDYKQKLVDAQKSLVEIRRNL